MSRIEKRNGGYTIAYGLDHIAGLFVQVFDNSRRNDEEDEPIVDMDAWTNPELTVEKIVDIAEEYGFDISAELSESTIQ